MLLIFFLGHEEDEYEDGQVDWWDFDDAAYLAKGALKPGEDPYQANKFNLAASDKIKPDRPVPDTRNMLCKNPEYDLTVLPHTSGSWSNLFDDWQSETRTPSIWK